MAVNVSGMFGNGHTYFADSPVVIDISGLEWADSSGNVASPFTVVRVKVIYEGNVVGEFYTDTGGQTSISFDISSALRAIWSDYTFDQEVSAAAVLGDVIREYRSYSLDIYTEYLDSQDGEFTTTYSGRIDGGQCAIGRFTEMERSRITNKRDADVSYREHSNLRNGDASTKPTSSPERVGRDSITSWVDVKNSGTHSMFFLPTAGNGAGVADSAYAHAPLVLRDSIPYTDFLFVNRRGAVETCSALTLDGMAISMETKPYARIERPTFIPSRSLMSITQGGRRSWSMSSGGQTREWAEWWVLEFLAAKRWWMLYDGRYVPVIIEPAKKPTSIYDRAKQNMPHVDFTVTPALEG